MVGYGKVSVPVVVAALLAAGAGCSRQGSRDRGDDGKRLSGDRVVFAVGERRLAVKLATTDRERQRGLMDHYKEPADGSRKEGVKYLDEDEGMLFIFAEAEYLRFWMKNTYIPLAIAFLDDEGKILQIEDMYPKDESNTRSKNQVRYALEVHKGWFKKAGLRVGDSLPDFREKVGGFVAERRQMR